MSGASWLSYSLQDFIMFGPEVFLRLFTRINEAIWPWQLVWLLAGLCLVWLSLKTAEWPRRFAMALAGLAWIGCGYLFLVRYYGPVNTPATWFGWAFVAQGFLLMMLRGRALPVPLCMPLAVSGWMAMLLLPWLPVVQAGDLRALAPFGVVPGVTVAATVPLLARQPSLLRWLLLCLPLAWCLFSALTFWALGTYWLLGFPIATLVLLVLTLRLNPIPVQSRDLQSAHPDPEHRLP